MSVVALTAEQIRGFVEPVVREHCASAFPEHLENIKTDYLISSWEILMKSGIGCAYGIEKDGAPAGFLLGLYTMDMIIGQMQATEYLWVVSPQHRKGGAALRLLDRFERDAVAKGIKRILCGCVRVSNFEAMRRMYLRRGYTSLSESFLKEIQ